MKKRSIKFEVNFTNKWLYTFIALGVVLLLAIGVFAYNSGKPASVFGHSAGEIHVLGSSGQTVNLQEALNELNSKVALVDLSKCKICIHVSSNAGTLGNTPLFTECKPFNGGISRVFPSDQSGTPTLFNSKKEWIGVEVICD